MSVIAVRVHPSGAKWEIASDSSQIFNDETVRVEDEMGFSKLMKINNMVIGATGNCDESSHLFEYARIRLPGFHRPDAGYLRDFLQGFNEWRKENGLSHKNHKNQYVFGILNRVFMNTGWYISEILTYSAIGAGYQYALGALHTGSSARKAVEAACELSTYCCLPVKSFEFP
jgi:hypothetical protein